MSASTHPYDDELPLTMRAHDWCLDCHNWLSQLPEGTRSSEECAQVVGWFCTLVPAKLYRAANSLAPMKQPYETLDPRFGDAMDSAGLATHGLRRVIEVLTARTSSHPNDRQALALLAEARDLLRATEREMLGLGLVHHPAHRGRQP